MTNCFGCDGELVAVTLVNESCSPEWKINYNSILSVVIVNNVAPKTLQQCQYACVFNPDCVAVAWYARHPTYSCYMYSNPLSSISYNQNWNVYELVKRCNITAGLLYRYCQGHFVYVLM